MKPLRNLLYWAFVVLALVGLPDRAIAGVAIGDSTLLDLSDTSDSFTLTADGGIPGRVVNAYPVHAPGINVEDNHGNPAQVWTNAMWSVSADAGAIPGATPYPGGSGAGSATGMTQRGGGSGDWGIEYGLRNDFVVQTDFVQTTDRVDMTVGAARDTIGNPGNLSVFFRYTGHPSYPEIGLYNPTVGEHNTGLTSGIPAAGQWRNYATRFNLDSRVLAFYVDEVWRGSVDLDTVAGGAFAGLTVSNASTGTGYAGGDRGWSDNFQVGSPVARGVAVGASSAIGTLDYSDSFTLTAKGGNPGRVATAAGESPPATLMENNHGNPAQTWSSGMWSLTYDPAVWATGGSPYSGPSGSGSDTGFTQRGGGGDWGIEYGLRHDFVVQTDFIQTTDRVDITAGSARNTIGSAGGLSIFFRTTGHPTYPEIGIYAPSIGERDSGLTSGIASAGQWHNYAVRFNQVQRELEILVDGTARGTIDLDTVAGGAFASYAPSNRAVSIGGTGTDRTWSDNFQVGSSLAPPETLSALMVDYEDTFTINPPTRPDGLYNNNSAGGYNVETANFGNPAAVWTPFSNFSFNTPGSSTNPPLLGAAGGNAGAATGFAQSGGGDFSFAYGLRTDYIVSVDAILPSDRLDISSLPSAGAGIFAADSLSVFFRRDTSGLGAVGLFNGSQETWALAPGTLGINDNDWHNFAVGFNQDDDELRIFVDRELIADLDLTTFAGGIYQDYSNAAVGAGGAGGVFWVDNFQVGAVPEPSTIVLAGIGLLTLVGCGLRRRKRAKGN